MMNMMLYSYNMNNFVLLDSNDFKFHNFLQSNQLFLGMCPLDLIINEPDLTHNSLEDNRANKT